MNYINLIEINQSKYRIEFKPNKYLGDFIMEIDGYFVWYPDFSNFGFYSDYVLLELGNKLKELNKDWDNKIKQELNK